MNTRPPIRICSCWADCSPPISGRPPAAPDFFALAGVGPTETAPSRLSLPNGSLNGSFVAMVFPLSQELAVAADDRQVDELRAGVVGRRIADEEAAEVDVAHLLHLRDEGF